MPNTFRPRGAPNADPNANYYQDWELTNRPAMFPFLAEYTNTQTGEKSGGMAMPSMVTSPANALWQLVGPQGGMWDIENPQNADALREVNMATLGGEAFPAITRNALAKEAIPNALSHSGPRFDFANGTSGSVNGTRLRYSPQENGGVYIKSLETPQAEAGRGQARSLMEAMTRQADEQGVPLSLDAQGWDAHTDVDKLRDFYRSLGFVDTPHPSGYPGYMERVPNALSRGGGSNI